MVMINENVLSNSRRIDELNKRIGETNKRIDLIYVEIGNIKKEMERVKREDAVTADILHRMEVLEERVLLKQPQ
jgi:peptidoglycan hydrolase CwlO-like protein